MIHERLFLLAIGHGRLFRWRARHMKRGLMQHCEELKRLDGLLSGSSTQDVKRGVDGGGEGDHGGQKRRIFLSCSSLDPMDRKHNI